MSLTCFSYILHTPLTLPIFLQSKKSWFSQVNRSDFVSSSLVKDDPVCDDSEQGGQDQAGKVVRQTMTMMMMMMNGETKKVNYPCEEK